MKIFSFLFVFFISSFLLFGQSPNELNETFWKATITGNTNLLLKLKIDKDAFSLTSSKGSAKNIIGTKYVIARLLRKVKQPYAINIKGKCYFRNDTLFLEGKYVSLTSKQNFKGYISNDKLTAKMTRNRMVGQKIPKQKRLSDYYKITLKAIELTEDKLYDPALIKDKKWKSFKKDILKVSKKVFDDYEFQKAYNFRGQSLPFTHYGIMLIPLNKNTNVSSKNKNREKFKITKIDSNTILFTVKTFSADAHEIQPFIDTIRNLNPKNLIIDLRNNPGGSIASALPLASFLTDDTLYGGLFLTQKYFASHRTLPKPEEYRNFTKFDTASYSLIIEGIHKQDGICLVIPPPDKKPYKGKVFVLTNRHTGSTGEPLVYGLKYYKRAVIVGERTAGAMLNGEKFKLTDKFDLWMPTATYYTVDGKKLDKRGVYPDIEVESDKALSKVLEILAKK